MFSRPPKRPLYAVSGQDFFAKRDQAAFFLASASISTPIMSPSFIMRYSTPYEVLDTIDFDLGARPFAEQDAVADLDVNRDELAAIGRI
jgi:hypothetical protein